jgi:hypothetical protein
MQYNTRFVIQAVIMAALMLSGLSGLVAQGALAQPVPAVQIIPHFEQGFVGVLYHHYQSGVGGTDFNFITQGGQDILFPYQRYSVELVLGGHSRFTFLYQPLTINTRTVVDRNGSGTGDIVIDGTAFPSGTPLDITYGFDFWRLSYLYDVSNDPRTILGLGASLQVRNASIVFTSSGLPAPGSGPTEVRAVSQNIGPVPILKMRAAHWFSPLFGLDFEADGFYASSAFFNGATQAFTGWIWDAALSARSQIMANAAAYLTVRSIGGGASGNNAYSYSSSTTSTPGSPTYNALATFAVTLGATIQW